MAGTKLYTTNTALTSGTVQTSGTGTRAMPGDIGGSNGPSGQNMTWSKYVNGSSTISVAAAIVLGSLPEGAVVLEGVLSGVSKKAGVYSIGLASSAGVLAQGASTYTNAAVLLSAASLISTAKTFRFNAVPYSVPAITTTAAQRFWAVIAKHVSGTLCKTFNMTLSLIYTTAGK